MATIKPLKDKVLVAQVAREHKTSSGIILEGGGDTGDTKTGLVIAVGPDVVDVQPGDEILLDWTKAQICKVDDAARVMVREKDVIAVVG